MVNVFGCYYIVCGCIATVFLVDLESGIELQSWVCCVFSVDILRPTTVVLSMVALRLAACHRR